MIPSLKYSYAQINYYDYEFNLTTIYWQSTNRFFVHTQGSGLPLEVDRAQGRVRNTN